MLSVDQLSSGYGDLQVLWGVDIAVREGEVVVLAGPNGAGKSTLIRTVAGVIRPIGGKIHFAGEDVTSRSHSRRLRSGIGWVPEGRLLYDDLTVAENLRLSAFMAGLSKKDYGSGLDTAFAVFPELEDWLQMRAGRLSGGQQQILAVARAVVRQPRLILLDEPSVGLAPMIVSRIGEQLARMKDAGVGVLIAEQNVSWLEGVADQVVILNGGRFAGRVEPRMLGSREFFRQAYLSV